MRAMERGDLWNLVKTFQEGNQVEIDGLMDAMIVVVLQRYYGNFSRNILGESITGTVRRLDMLFLSRGVQELDVVLQDSQVTA